MFAVSCMCLPYPSPLLLPGVRCTPRNSTQGAIKQSFSGLLKKLAIVGSALALDIKTIPGRYWHFEFQLLLSMTSVKVTMFSFIFLTLINGTLAVHVARVTDMIPALWSSFLPC